MAVTLFGPGEVQYFTNSGAVLTGGKLHTYEPGTTTDKAAYPTQNDADANTNAHTNPIVLDSAGRAQVWLDGQYKLVLKDSAGTTIWTVDEVGDVSDVNVFDKNHLAGLVLTNNSTDGEHDIDIAAGEARDGGNSEDLVLSSSIIKQIDAPWAVGSNAGGLDTGSVTVNKWYHLWLIKRTDTDVVDALYSTSASAPTMPTNYDKKRRIGAVLTDSSSNILAFTQFGDEILWADPPLNVNVTDLGTSTTLYAIGVPVGLKMIAIVNIMFSANSGTVLVYVRSPDSNDEAPSLTAAPLVTALNSATGDTLENINGFAHIRTDTSARIAARADAASTTLRVACLGWIDHRGKLD